MERRKHDHCHDFEDPEAAASFYTRHKRWSLRDARDLVKRLRAAGLNGGRVLDAGCGFGTLAIEVAKAFPGTKVVGIDISRPMLDIALSEARDAGLGERVTFETRNITSLGYEDGTFDAVISVNVLHHVEPPERMLAEIDRVLRPGGILIIKDLRRSWLGHLDHVIASAYSLEEVRRMVEASGMRSVMLGKGMMSLTMSAGGGQGKG